MKEIIKDGGNIHVKLDGDLTSTKNVTFETEIISLIHTETPREIIINMDGVNMMDSYGIRQLLAIHTAIDGINGTLKVINLSEDIFGLLKYMRLDTHFYISKK